MTDIKDPFEILENLRRSMVALTEHEPINDRITLVAAYQALKRCRGVEGLSPDARKQVLTAFEMCAAALGIEAREAA